MLKFLSFICFFAQVLCARQQRQKRNTSTAEEKDFVLLWKERAIADLLEKYWIAVATGNIHMKTSQEQK